jgi:hypothetical protein
MTAITTKAKRRKHDFYPTPASGTKALIEHCPDINGVLLECCSGANDIASVLKGVEGAIVLTNDIDDSRNTDFHLDISTPLGWMLLNDSISYSGEAGADWIVTNPPFNLAPEIVPLAYEHAAIGVAMLLRLSFLEPCLNRSEFLIKHPPTKLIVLPRISFTGDGGVDSVTCAWMIWDKRVQKSSVEIVGSLL